MKNLKFLLLLLLGLSTLACEEINKAEATDQQATLEQNSPAIDEAQEKEAMLSVIEAETECFFNRDYDCWKSHWVQEAYTFQAWNYPDGTYDAKVGWSTVHKESKAYIEANPIKEGEVEKRLVKRQNIQAKFFTLDLAYLIWEQINQTIDGKSGRKSQETRIMQKIENEWKIVNVTSYWDYTTELPIESLEE